ncbi:Uncharacterised protein [uncultured archaeon]|nr:Uncharacterised protein [uncultured archaeon]
MARTGQASVEFAVVIAAVFTIFIISGYVIYQKQVRSSDVKLQIEGDRILKIVAEAVNEVNIVGDGYHQTLTLPAQLYGDQPYEVFFVSDEPTVFMRGGSFVGGTTHYWSAPLSSPLIYCPRYDCASRCNQTLSETCLPITSETNVRVVNEHGKIYVTDPYSLTQEDEKRWVTPLTGIGNPYQGAPCKQGGTVFLYRDVSNQSLYLVFKLNGTGEVKFDLNETWGGPVVELSDDPGELSFGRKPEGHWGLAEGGCDGGVISYSAGFMHTCIIPEMPISMNLTFLDREGTRIHLQNNEKFCITYP